MSVVCALTLPASSSASSVNGLIDEPGSATRCAATSRWYAARTLPVASSITTAVPDLPAIARVMACCNGEPSAFNGCDDKGPKNATHASRHIAARNGPAGGSVIPRMSRLYVWIGGLAYEPAMLNPTAHQLLATAFTPPAQSCLALRNASSLL